MIDKIKNAGNIACTCVEKTVDFIIKPPASAFTPTFCELFEQET
jgi:hypothetical protein